MKVEWTGKSELVTLTETHISHLEVWQITHNSRSDLRGTVLYSAQCKPGQLHATLGHGNPSVQLGWRFYVLKSIYFIITIGRKAKMASFIDQKRNKTKQKN